MPPRCKLTSMGSTPVGSAFPRKHLLQIVNRVPLRSPLEASWFTPSSRWAMVDVKLTRCGVSLWGCGGCGAQIGMLAISVIHASMPDVELFAVLGARCHHRAHRRGPQQVINAPKKWEPHIPAFLRCPSYSLPSSPPSFYMFPISTGLVPLARGCQPQRLSKPCPRPAAIPPKFCQLFSCMPISLIV